jgi:hypothetical protein
MLSNTTEKRQPKLGSANKLAQETRKNEKTIALLASNKTNK